VNHGRRLADLPLWGPRFSHEALVKLSQDPASGPTFRQGYQMDPIKPGDLLFPHFESCWNDDVLVGELMKRFMPAIVGVDLSGKARPGNAIVVVGLEPQSRKRYLLDVRHGNWRSPDVVEQIDQVCRLHNVNFVMVENNGYQQSIIDWIYELRDRYPWWMKVEAHTTGTNKADPRYGLPGLDMEFKNGAWVFPASQWAGHLPGCPCSWCLFKREFARYPRYSTQDLVMATWFAKTAIDKWMWAPSGSGQQMGDMHAR
jgi:hypothetical protein